MNVPSRTNTKLCDAYRARLMAEASTNFGTHDLRAHVDFACGRDDGVVDRKMLASLLQHAPRLEDPAQHADILIHHVTPAEHGPELVRSITIDETYGFAGVRMLDASDLHPRGRTPLYVPTPVIGKLSALVTVRDGIATAATKAGEARTTPEVVLSLLFDEWEKGGPKAKKARAFIQEMSMGIISLMEHEANQRFDRAVAFKDDFNVSAVVQAHRVIVIDGDTAVVYEDLGAFRREKLLLADRIGKSYTQKDDWKQHLPAIRDSFATGKISQAINYGADDPDAIDEMGLLGCFDILFRKLELTLIVPRSCIVGRLPKDEMRFKIG